MRFNDLDTRMRQYETATDYCVPDEIWMVARLDGRGFTRLTKDIMDYEVPFDERFRDAMVETTKYLMREAGFNMIYGYTESDEISLLLALDDQTFGRKLRKINSILAGEASAKFSWMLNRNACFDCRVSCLPNQQLVIDYFRWRQEDCSRNALNSWCYWTLRKEGLTARAATAKLLNLSVSDKNELLFQRGINYNDLPLWQRRGCGVVWERYQKAAQNPKTGEAVAVWRRRLLRDLALSRGDQYGEFVEKVIEWTVARTML